MHSIVNKIYKNFLNLSKEQKYYVKNLTIRKIYNIIKISKKQEKIWKK